MNYCTRTKSGHYWLVSEKGDQLPGSPPFNDRVQAQTYADQYAIRVAWDVPYPGQKVNTQKPTDGQAYAPRPIDVAEGRERWPT